MPSPSPSSSSSAAIALGLDFGTTNTVIAASTQPGVARTLPFTLAGDTHATFRSAMCFWDEDTGAAHDLRFEAGPWAIERFIDDPIDCRFLQSFKTFAASRSFTETHIHGRKFTFEDLLTAFIEKMRSHAGGALDDLPPRLVAGRPVAFAGVNPNEALALERYERAFRRVGFGEILYVYEPVAAAYFFAQRLKQAATVLVADFGGGTSDFSIIRFEPGSGKGGALKSIPLAHSGVAVAGDVFDYRILEHAILPQLGHRAKYRSIDKILEVPTHFHHRFAQWNQLALMKSPAVLRDLREYLRYAIERDGLGKFIALIENDLGYPLYKAVADTKAALSNAPSATLAFRATGLGYDLALDATIERAAFDQWIADDLQKIEDAVDEALGEARLDAKDIDRVFLTGGTSFVPAVRAIFDQRFDPTRIETGDQLESIAYGLALIARSDDPQAWAASASR
ncbi:MAG TPA: Hsp70 family protein [Casimicrobium huifangae]|jgi:hypothetical chaperone protein|uniref:Hsp70 family protein n=1 Tax=Casimicrobium huifangae TaxID=2591109 RepID=UPI002C04B463|nr:Hsp70 family protein [Casimicrobium huifangae]HQA32393.1 Hsp70 family protein [Casimicrobium huifangae]HQD63986.1 Hsp70 family protein [Casimicrobium huifangae]